jgi:nucleoid-associated protein YgaU
MGAAPAVAATAGVVAAGRGHGVTAQPVAGPLDWPSLEQRDPPSSGATHRPDQHVSAVVVRAGDCLWSIAQRPLGPAATPAAVASSWPRWWSANRDVIGPDPGLLHPGQLLRAPVRTDGRTTR